MTGTRLRSLSLLALIAAVVTVMAACGGNTSTSSSGSATTASSSAASSAGASSPSEGSTSAGSSSAGGGDGGPATGGSLSSQASKALDHDFTITYSMNGPSGVASAMTVYWEAPGKRWRVDTKSSAGTITLMDQGNATIYCLDTQKTCTKSTAYSTQTSQIPFFSQGLTDPEAFAAYVTDQLGTDVSTSSKVIAGEDATCYDAGSGAGSGEVCFGESDLILAWTGSVGGQEIGLVATKVDDSVSRKDFEPPYKVADLGNVLPP
jgi:hypothetical protein